MASNESQTLVLHPDSSCSLINNLLDNINQYVLKVHKHVLGTSVVPTERSHHDVSHKNSGEINPGCRLCSVAIDGVALRNKKSRTYGVEAAEEADEYHQRNDDLLSGKEVCYCSTAGSNAHKNIFVKIKSDDKEIVEWFKKTRAEHISGKNREETGVTAVRAPFTARVRQSPSTISNRDNIQLDVSIERIPEDSRRRSSEPKSVRFEDQDKSFTRSVAKHVFTEISNVFKRIANMFHCGRASCKCNPRSESENYSATEEEQGEETKSLKGSDSLNNLVVAVNSNSGEEKFVRMSSWDNTKDFPVYSLISKSSEFDDSNAKDIVEILRNRRLNDIPPSPKGTYSKRKE